MLHVGCFTVGTAEAAARHGADVREETRSPAPDGRLAARAMRSRRRAAMIEADRVVATGISNVGPFGYFRRRIVPIGSFAIATERLDQATIDSVT